MPYIVSMCQRHIQLIGALIWRWVDRMANRDIDCICVYTNNRLNRLHFTRFLHLTERILKFPMENGDRFFEYQLMCPFFPVYSRMWAVRSISYFAKSRIFTSLFVYLCFRILSAKSNWIKRFIMFFFSLFTRTTNIEINPVCCAIYKKKGKNVNIFIVHVLNCKTFQFSFAVFMLKISKIRHKIHVISTNEWNVLFDLRELSSAALNMLRLSDSYHVCECLVKTETSW